MECHVKVQRENVIPNYRKNIKAKVQRKTKAQPFLGRGPGGGKNAYNITFEILICPLGKASCLLLTSSVHCFVKVQLQ